MGDPVISILTVVLILMLFVFAPLQALGIAAFHVLGFVSALVLIGGVFFLSASHVVAAAMLTAFAMAIWAAFARLTAPSSFDVYLGRSTEEKRVDVSYAPQSLS
jgi:hypothetical protein